MRRILGTVPILFILASLVPSGIVEATSFEPDVGIPLPVGTMSAFDFDIAVAGPEARISWYDQLASGSFQAAYASIATNGTPPRSDVLPFVDAISSALRVRVAALPLGRFAFAWQDAAGTIWTAIQEDTGWRGPMPTFTSLPDPEGGFDLAAWGDWLYVAWVEANGFNGTLVVSRVSPVDLYSKAESRVDDHLTARKFEPSLTARGSEAYVAWRRGTPTESAVFAAHGPVNGTWPSPTSVTRDLTEPYEFRPRALLLPNGTFGVMWQDWAPIRDGTGGPETFVALATSPSGSFEAPLDLGAAVGAAFFDDPAVAVDDSGGLRVVWLDGDPATQTGRFRVMYAESDAAWAAFSPPRKLNSDSSTLGREAPVIGFGAAGRVFVAWGDRRDGGLSRPYLAISSGPAGPPGTPPWLPLALTLGPAGAGVAMGLGAHILASRLKREPKGRT